jgi:putative acetyltransferase
MPTLKRTNSENIDFINLVQELDKALHEINGDEQAFFTQFNKIDMIKHVVIAYENNIPIGCGAIKEYSSDIMEVKRMFVDTKSQGKGTATQILKELELWVKELGYKKCILETGIKQTRAIALYKRNNFEIIENYGQYKNIKDSVCFGKNLF